MTSEAMKKNIEELSLMHKIMQQSSIEQPPLTDKEKVLLLLKISRLEKDIELITHSVKMQDLYNRRAAELRQEGEPPLMPRADLLTGLGHALTSACMVRMEHPEIADDSNLICAIAILRQIMKENGSDEV